MSRQADETRGTGTQRGKGKPKDPKGPTGIIAFHPTVTQAAELRMGVMPIGEAIDYLGKVMERGVGVSLGFRQNQGAVFAMAKDKGQLWQVAATVSAWHSDCAGAIRALAYFLREVYPEFPDDVGGPTGFTDEW